MCSRGYTYECMCVCVPCICDIYECVLHCIHPPHEDFQALTNCAKGCFPLFTARPLQRNVLRIRIASTTTTSTIKNGVVPVQLFFFRS